MLKFTEELVVRIWEHGGPGHAAGTIRAAMKNSESTFTIAGQTYISWWPSDRQKKNDPSDLLGTHKNPSPLAKQVASPNLSYLEDKRDETGESTRDIYGENPEEFAPRPHQRIREDVPRNTDKILDENAKLELQKSVVTSAQHNIHIPGLSSTPILAWKDEKNRQLYGEFLNKTIINQNNHFKDRNQSLESDKAQIRQKERTKKNNQENYYSMPIAAWGLNLNLMVHWWTEFLADTNKFYRFASTESNCAGAMMGALMAGGMGAYIPVKKALMFYKPQEVKNYAQALQTRLFSLNEKTFAFHTKNQENIINIQDKDIWKCETFQANSKSKKYAFRMEQVKTIDACLQSYHKLGDWNPANFIEKLGLLVKIMDNVLDHLEKKPNSDRRAGVVQLGCQIVKLLMTEKGKITQWARNDNDPKLSEYTDSHQHKYEIGNLIYECQKANTELSKRRNGERVWRKVDINLQGRYEERMNRMERTSPSVGQHRSSNKKK